MTRIASRPTAGALALARAAYVLHPDERAWLDGVVDAARAFDVGGGVAAVAVRLDAVPRLAATAAPRTPDEEAALASLIEVTRTLPSHASARGLFAPTEFARNPHWRLERLRHGARGTLRGALDAIHGTLPPMWTLLCGDGQRHAVALCFLSPDGRVTAEKPYPHPEFRQLALAGAHLGAALRLRRALVRPISPDDPETEAVLDARGATHHAVGLAKKHRHSLAEAVRRMPSTSRTPLPPDEALRLWQALVQGTWSLIDHVDADGKRLFLARRNTLDGGAPVAGLTADELAVVRLTALGHSYKFVAYELGISRSTVVRRLARASAKLGAKDRRELARHFGGNLGG